MATLKINASFVEKVLVNFIRQELKKFNFKKGILGLSGGLDSSVCATLACRAIGPENTIAIIMPYKDMFSSDVVDADNLVKKLGIVSYKIDISPQIDAYFARQPSENVINKGNKMARERMSIIYDFSSREKALPLGTSNKTELLIGYGTIYGDLASAINPLGDLYKTQVRQLGRHLGLPEKILKKTPTAGLWPGQTDEGEIGLTYQELDQILFHLVDLRMDRQKLIDRGFSASSVTRVIEMIERSEFKRKPPQIAKISYRSVGHDFLYPYDRGK